MTDAKFARTASGILIPDEGTRRAWLKFAGDPAQILVENPEEFLDRWLVFMAQPAIRYCIYHELSFGQPVYLFRPSIEHLYKIDTSYKPDEGQRRAGSIYLGQCDCAVCLGSWPGAAIPDHTNADRRRGRQEGEALLAGA
jgi:hypothetical protein